jgi:hypothetical protein
MFDISVVAEDECLIEEFGKAFLIKIRGLTKLDFLSAINGLSSWPTHQYVPPGTEVGFVA